MQCANSDIRKKAAYKYFFCAHTAGMKEENGKGKNAGEIAWEMFEKTGSLTYYMLYHQLKK